MSTDSTADATVGSPSSARVLVDSRNRLGECALWCERDKVLYWTDIDNARLFRWRLYDGSVTDWPMPEPLASFALCDTPGWLLLGLASGTALFDLSTGRVGPLIPVEAEEPRTRINDGRCDPQGRFVFGMFNPHGAAVGGYYRVNGLSREALRIEQLPLPPAVIGNSLCFSPDGGTLYYTDSPQRLIWALDYHADGRLGERRVHIRIEGYDVEPDGAAIDTEGGLWSALWGAGAVARFDTQGRETHRLALPASQPTCPVFGGPDLDRLWVTTARKDREHEPLAGAVFELDPQGFRGLPPHRFALR
ncbi:SMP-30/gluconolactonase/LRE family protein [Roseateles depolymerans]|uniref:Gluconolaconase n=1 Tax=Roseateles depolymerans TaxID=76731 RepID=A0A0U3CEE7_9BURK|nr:SMP-30/gluconolactonase/LRE family protein [Roseateles depolymerans]ALV07096.1 gluconolaconase [Roseateles depolymerans]REG20079.1 L-arabinonolactonase [Roseateles depolymerans]